MKEAVFSFAQQGCMAAVIVAGLAMVENVVLSEGQAATLSALSDDRGISLEASRMPKWRAMSRRHAASRSSAAWRKAVAEARAAPPGKAIDHVNRIVNKVRYSPDSRVWGRSDYWAAPSELFTRGGDCEDFAIAKYMLLKDLGVSASRMRIIITRDHAVLAVNDNGQTRILDNRRSQTYRLNSAMVTRAVFVINDRTWWVNSRSRLAFRR